MKYRGYGSSLFIIVTIYPFLPIILVWTNSNIPYKGYVPSVLSFTTHELYNILSVHVYHIPDRLNCYIIWGCTGCMVCRVPGTSVYHSPHMKYRRFGTSKLIKFPNDLFHAATQGFMQCTTCIGPIPYVYHYQCKKYR